MTPRFVRGVAIASSSRRGLVMVHTFRRLLALLGIAAVSACSGGAGGRTSSLPALPTSPVAGATAASAIPTSANLRVAIPSPTSPSAAKRAPAYVSPATNSLTIVQRGGSPQTMNLGASSPSCTSGSAGRTCTIAIVASPGVAQSFTVSLYASTDGSGPALATQTIVHDIVAHADNELAFTLNGVVASLSVALVDPTLAAGTAATTTVVVGARDASGATIVGPGGFVDASGAPVTITVTDGDTSGATHLAAASTFTQPGTVALAYTGANAITRAVVSASAPSFATASATLAFATATTPGTRLRSGHVVLPTGSPIDLASLTITNSLGSSAVSSTGSFLLPSFTAGPQFATVTNAAGTPILCGFLSDAEPDASAHSTTVALMFQAAAAYTLPDALQLVFLGQIGAYPTEAAVETQVTSALRSTATDPIRANAVGISGALSTAFPVPSLPPTGSSIGTPTMASARRATAATHTAAANVRRSPQGLITDPTGQVSGLTLIQQFPNGVAFQNVYRRVAEVYVDETAPHQKSLSTLPLFQISSIPSLSGNVVLTVSDILTGNFAFTPITSSTIALPTEPGATETDYRLQVLGPGMLAGGDPLDGDQQVEYTHLATLFYVQNIVVPFLFSVVLPIGASGYDAGSSQAAYANSLGDIVNIVAGLPGVAQQISSGDDLGALQAIESAIATSNTYQARVLNDLGAISATAGGTTLVSGATSAAFATASSVLTLANAVLTSIDVTAVTYSVAHAHQLDTWTVRETPPVVRLAPASASLADGQSVTFTAAVSDFDASDATTSLVYQWSVAPAFGGGAGGSLVGATASSGTVTYQAPKTGTGSDVVTVAVTAFDSATATKTPIGTASANVVVAPLAGPAFCDGDFTGFQFGGRDCWQQSGFAAGPISAINAGSTICGENPQAQYLVGAIADPSGLLTSAVSQTFLVPPSAQRLTLLTALEFASAPGHVDAQDVPATIDLTDQAGTLHHLGSYVGTPLFGPRPDGQPGVVCNGGSFRQLTFDLTPYRNQLVVLKLQAGPDPDQISQAVRRRPAAGVGGGGGSPTAAPSAVPTQGPGPVTSAPPTPAPVPTRTIPPDIQTNTVDFSHVQVF